MPKTVTVRFFQVGRIDPRGVTLRDALGAIEALGQPGARELQIGQGIRVRLERYHATAGYLTGEMTRVRHDDHPAEIHHHGTAQLNVAGAIGEGVAFRYREADHILAMQFDNRTLSPSRFIDYVQQLVPAARFTFLPKIDANALRHFRAHPLRKAKIRLAQPQDLTHVEPTMASAARAIRSLGRDYAAPTLTLEIRMGHEEGSLGRDAKNMLEGFIRRAAVDSNIKTVKATPDNGPGVDNTEIDLLDQILAVKSQIPNPSNNPDANYDARRRVVERALNGHV